MKYKFINDEERIEKHYIEGVKIKYGDEFEFNETDKKVITNLLRHNYIEEVEEIENEDTDTE